MELWSSIEEAVNLGECVTFSYVPDLDSDPFSEGILWSFNYFFFNKTLKRLVYFTCIARPRYAPQPAETDDQSIDDDDERIDWQNDTTRDTEMLPTDFDIDEA